MNSENAPKEIVQSFIGLANMAIGMINESQQQSVTQELRRLFPSTRGGGRRGERGECLTVVAGGISALTTDTNITSFATGSTTERTTEEIWGSRTV